MIPVPIQYTSHNHAKTEVEPDSKTRAYHDFLLGAKLYWTRQMYAELHNAYQKQIAASGSEPQTVEAAEAMMKDTWSYQSFAWFERHLQRFKYSGPYGILKTVRQQHKELEQSLNEACANAGPYLRLNPHLEYPHYYTAVDFHQHPGGVWRDELAGFAYEYGRKTTTPNHVHEDDLHHRFAAACPKRDYRRILDFGCGVGKSTYPFKDLYPNAEVYGIDLSAPCLKLAHLRARESGRQIFYSQQNMEQTDFPGGYFDLIHTTFIQHELPIGALRLITAEAFYLLKPGGLYVNLDFHSAPGGMFGKFVHFGHARRNNEVFMRAFHEFDYLRLLREVGFATAEMLPFDDGTGLITDPATVPSNWRFPWQMFVAQKAG